MNNKFVSLTYDLYISRDGKEELMESTTLENPLTFCSGLQLLLPKFEDEVTPLLQTTCLTSPSRLKTPTGSTIRNWSVKFLALYLSRAGR